MSDQGCCPWPLLWAETTQCLEILRLLPPATQPLWFCSPFWWSGLAESLPALDFPWPLFSLVHSSVLWRAHFGLTPWFCGSLPSKPTQSASPGRTIVSELSTAVPSLHTYLVSPVLYCPRLPCPLEQQHGSLSHSSVLGASNPTALGSLDWEWKLEGPGCVLAFDLTSSGFKK